MTSAISATDTVLEGLAAPGREPAARVVAPPARIPAVRAEVPLQPFYRLSVDQYHRMTEAGILTSEDRVELLEGVLVEKMTKRSRHAWTSRYLFKVLGLLIGTDYFVCKEDPILLSASEPEPDLAVIRGDDSRPPASNPAAADVVLVVEVADAGYAAARRKLAIYAAAGIPVYWIVNLEVDRVEVYTNPTGPDAAPEYRNRVEYGIEQKVPVELGGKIVGEIGVRAALLGEG